jgi:hypothetical protein
MSDNDKKLLKNFLNNCSPGRTAYQITEKTGMSVDVCGYLQRLRRTHDLHGTNPKSGRMGIKPKV